MRVTDWQEFHPYFTRREFVCRCCGEEHMDRDFMLRLELARACSGIPFIITSGYRCAERNKAVGGVPGSAHCRGYAVDIAVRADHERFMVLKWLLVYGFRRIGIGKGFIHVDSDPEKPTDVAWLYGKGGTE